MWLEKLVAWDVISFLQAFFLVAIDGPAPWPVAVALLQQRGSSPRSVAKTPKPKKGRYIFNSMPDALCDPINSAAIAAWKKKGKYMKQSKAYFHLQSRIRKSMKKKRRSEGLNNNEMIWAEK